MTNPLGIRGLSFVELASPTPSAIEALLAGLGFSRTHEHAAREVELFRQNDIRILLTREHGSHAHGFAEEHGPSISRTPRANAQFTQGVSSHRSPDEQRSHRDA